MIPESLIQHAQGHWQRGPLTLVSEVEGFYLLHAPWNGTPNGGSPHYVIALLRPSGHWQGWCCSDSVLEGRNSSANQDIPDHIRELFRDMLSLLP